MTVADELATQPDPVPGIGRSHTVVIIGSGFGGQAAAVNLRKRGISDFILLERRDFIGGTWKQNSYPGAAVDVPSPLYSLSFEPYPWTQMFADGAELGDYTEHVLDKYRIRERTVLGAEVTRLEWTATGWLIETEGKGSFFGQFVINASGPLSHPVIPPFPGRESFAGVQFHTNDWDHSVDLRGKKVAVVGSGASAAQVIPAIQPEVGELHVFQRTPHWVLPRGDRQFTPFQRRLMRNPLVYKAIRSGIYWQYETRVIGFKYSEWMLKKVAQTKALATIRRQIKDPQLRAKVTPDYTIGCKRIILSNTLYPALAAANTTLHDRTDAIASIDPSGITTTQGTHLDLDAIIWSTGYDATDGAVQYSIIGRDGIKIGDFWSEFPRAYQGTTMPGFPNFFVVVGPNTGIGHTSAIFIIEAQMEYIMRAIEAVRKEHATSIEPRATAEAAYTNHIHKEMERTVWKSGGCTSWYQSKSGHVIAMYPGFSFTFRQQAKHFRPADHTIA